MQLVSNKFDNMNIFNKKLVLPDFEFKRSIVFKISSSSRVTGNASSDIAAAELEELTNSRCSPCILGSTFEEKLSLSNSFISSRFSSGFFVMWNIPS